MWTMIKKKKKKLGTKSWDTCSHKRLIARKNYERLISIMLEYEDEKSCQPLNLKEQKKANCGWWPKKLGDELWDIPLDIEIVMQ